VYIFRNLDSLEIRKRFAAWGDGRADKQAHWQLTFGVEKIAAIEKK
jgi:hypothetical protein